MNEREDVPSDRLVVDAGPELPAGDHYDADTRGTGSATSADRDWQWGDRWPPDTDRPSDDEWPANGDWDWAELPYDESPYADASAAGAATRLSWYRRPGVLIALIIGALVALVVASVLLLTRATFSEQDEVRLKPTIRTSSIVLPSSTKPTATTGAATSMTPGSTTPTQTSNSSETSRSAPAPAEESEESQDVPEQLSPAPAGPTAGGAIGEQDPDAPLRPRVNVTRTPMSFAPEGR